MSNVQKTLGAAGAAALGALASVATGSATPARAAEGVIKATHGDFSKLKLKSNPMAGAGRFASGAVPKKNLKAVADLLIRLYENPATTDVAAGALKELLNETA